MNEESLSIVSGERMTFTATWADFSRTAVQENGKDVWWMPGDSVNLFFGNRFSGVFTSVNTEPVAQTDFVGTLNVIVGAMESTAGSSDYIAVYPYSPDNTCVGDTVSLTLPFKQTGVAGSFANNFFPAVARSTTPELAFYNLCGGACFTLDTTQIRKIVFSSTDGTPLAGRVAVAFDEDGKPCVTDVLEPMDSVVLCAPLGGFQEEVPYYVTFLPGIQREGLTVHLYTEGQHAFTYIDSVAIRRNVFGRKHLACRGLEFVDDPDWGLSFADSLVTQICLQHFDSNGDGRISRIEAEAVTSFGYCFNDKPIVTFDETVYFTGVTNFDGAFNGCSYLKSITIPSWFTSLGANSFMNCTSLASVTIPSAVSSLGTNCFRGCTALEEVELPEELLSVGNYAFYGCTSLGEISLPPTVTSIGQYAFGACSSLRSFEFPVSLKKIGNSAFVGCAALQHANLEFCESLTTIGASAFSGCTGTLDFAFTIPANVTSIGSLALKDFKYINVRPLTPPAIATDSFISTARFGVPEESIKQYKKKGTNWYKYANWIYPDTCFYPPSLTPITDTRKRLDLFGVTQDFIKVQAGSYVNAKNKTVTLTRDYWLAETELSRAMWIAVMNADPSNFQPTMEKAINCPVNRVSWEDVQSFISSLNKLVPSTYRLPSEAEWEFAARGGNQSQQYVYSGSNVLDEVAWYTENSKCCLDTSGAVRQQPHPAKELAPNELGFYDMSGNVYEWVNDYYSATLPSGTNPTGPSNDGSYMRRVMRGGDYISTASFCTVDYRTYKKQTENASNLGFRLAL